jgi:hypothetical protein
MPVFCVVYDGEKAFGNRFEQLVADHGIATDRSAPATPAQNGTTERSEGGGKVNPCLGHAVFESLEPYRRQYGLKRSWQHSI